MNDNKYLVMRVIKYAKPYTKLIIIAIIFTLIYSIIQPLFAVIQKHAIDNYLIPFTLNDLQDNIQNSLNSNEMFKGLSAAAGLYAFLKLLSFVLEYFSNIFISYLGQNVLKDIRKDMFEHFLSLELSYFDKNPIGKLITRVTSDVDSINKFIGDGLVKLISTFFLIISYFFIMFSLDWRLTLLVLIILPSMILITDFFGKKIRIAFRLRRDKQALVNIHLNENITGAVTVKLFNRENKSAFDFDLVNRDLLDASTNVVKIFSVFMAFLFVLMGISIALIVYFSAYFMASDLEKGILTGITVGTLVAFIQMTQQLFRPIQELADIFHTIQDAISSSEKIFEVLDTKPKIQDSLDAFELKDFKGEIIFKDVWFSYDDSVDENTPERDHRWVLKGLNLHIKPGENVALVGRTGAGKTSIVSLINRFYDIQKGRILIDGYDIKQIKQKSLREHVAIVLQDVFLFQDTIFYNLTLGMDIDRSVVESICERIGIHDYIMSLPDGYETVLQERGAGISTGQKQLLSFSRAILKQKNAILVLDEATANIDAESEKKIQDALNKIMKNRTSVVIAHRLSTIEKADKIIVMHLGNIIEQGTHSELIAKSGYYAKLQNH